MVLPTTGSEEGMGKKKAYSPEIGQKKPQSSASDSHVSYLKKGNEFQVVHPPEKLNVLTPATALRLQQHIGNRRVNHILKNHPGVHSSTPQVQRIIINNFDESAALFQEAAMKRVLPVLYHFAPFNTLLKYAQTPKYKLNVIFDVKSGKELEQMEKGAGKGAAVTGIYFVDETLEEKIERLIQNSNAESEKAMKPEPVKKVDDTLNLTSIKRLRERPIDIKIIINADTASKKTLGEASQILAHEYIVHAMKYVALIEKIRDPEIKDATIQEELKQGYALSKSTIFKPEVPEGALHALKQHLHFAGGKDTDYEKAKELLKKVLQEEEWKDFENRDEDDKSGYMQYVLTMLKQLN